MTNFLEVKEVDLEERINQVANQLANSPEVEQLAAKIDVRDAQTIMSFGQETAAEISQFGDRILATITKSTVEDSGKMIGELSQIMKQFDKKDFEDRKPSFFQKVFKRVVDDITRILNKYQTIDKEISKIYIEIKQYESEINKTNIMLEEMFDKNINYYEALEKYIMAGKMIVEKMKVNMIPELEKKAHQSGQQIDLINLQNATNAMEMVDQRVHDLEMAKMVALQTAPQIKLIQKGNYNLLRKINSAFVITLPVFKTGIIQAVTIKRQKIQADAMKALDDTTNEMLKRNAENIAMQSVDIAKLTTGTSIKMETLEETFNTIMKGIEDTKQIEVENQQVREESRVKLQQLKSQLAQKGLGV